jgi:type I restriction enzyme S subunit
MNPERLLQHFERISEAPDAIPRLRRFILDLAVRGKLVEQNPNDEPAAELLKRIQAEKTQLVREGKIKDQEPLAKIADDEIGFDLPANWFPSRTGDLLTVIRGASPRPKGDPKYFSVEKTPYHWIKISDIRKHSIGRVLYDTDEFLTKAGMEKSVLLPKGTLVMTNSATIGVPIFLGFDGGCIHDGYLAFPYFPDSEISKDFFFILFQTLQSYAVKMARGMAQLNLNTGLVRNFPLGLPPFAEQHRIVAKVDELMALCDQLEVAKTEREQSRDRLVAASLHHLNSPADVAEANTSDAFRDHARFYFNHLPHLTTRPEHIKQLRQTILNLAVRSKLVNQDPNDEPAAVLHQRLIAEAKSYAVQNAIAQPRLDSVVEQAAPFASPPGWIWARLASLFKFITDGDHQPPPKSESGVAFLTIGNVTTGRLDFSNCRFVPQDYFDSVAPYRRPAKGDILYTVVGATYGRPALVETDRTFCVQRHIGILKPTSEVQLKYLRLLLASPLVYEQATRNLTGTAQPTIPLRPLRNFLVPLPPLAEQHRIVAKVDELMVLCDQLEVQLTTTEADSRRLLEAVLHEALAQD